jgi:uncharacterized membrane protein YdbT with pleckstrin-like domain
VPDLTIRPTTKYVKAGFLLSLALVAAAEAAYYLWLRGKENLGWLPFVPPVLLLWPVIRWVRTRFTRAIISTDRLRYQTGIASKSTRTIQLSKVQDVRVDQSFGQRFFGVGNLSIETAGETGRLTIPNVDRPQTIADQIMERSQGGTATA